MSATDEYSGTVTGKTIEYDQSVLASIRPKSLHIWLDDMDKIRHMTGGVDEVVLHKGGEEHHYRADEITRLIERYEIGGDAS